MLRPAGDAFDEEIENAFRGALGVRAGDAPARKMAVDVHPGEAVNQRPAGDLHLFRSVARNCPCANASASVRSVRSISSALSCETEALLS